MTSPTPVAAGARLDWSQVPAQVRGDVEATLGSPIVSARTQVGGFSPGAGVRVVCDDGVWVALVLEDVDGRRPGVPWTEPDVSQVAATLESVGATVAPRELPTFAETAQLLDAWELIRADPSDLPAALLDRLPEMIDHQYLAREVTAGDRLVHWDARADNVLVRGGEAVLLDWAWASRGAPWLDTLALAVDFRIQGGPDPDAFLAASPVTRGVPGEHLAAVVAALVGLWHERARRPAPPRLPTVRAWQAHSGAAALDWLDTGTLWR